MLNNNIFFVFVIGYPGHGCPFSKRHLQLQNALDHWSLLRWKLNFDCVRKILSERPKIRPNRKKLWKQNGCEVTEVTGWPRKEENKMINRNLN